MHGLGNRVHRDTHVNLSFLDEAEDPQGPALDQLNLDVRVRAPIAAQERRQNRLEDLRRAAHAQNPDAAAAERVRAITERLDHDECIATPPEQVFAFRR